MPLNNRETARPKLTRENDMKTVLSYGEILDWGVKPLPPKYAKVQGSTVFLLACLYLWKYQKFHAAFVSQACLAALVITVGVSLAFLFWKKPGRTVAYQFWFQLAFALLMTILLLHL